MTRMAVLAGLLTVLGTFAPPSLAQPALATPTRPADDPSLITTLTVRHAVERLPQTCHQRRHRVPIELEAQTGRLETAPVTAGSRRAPLLLGEEEPVIVSGQPGDYPTGWPV